jgi:hypothetical protein
MSDLLQYLIQGRQGDRAALAPAVPLDAEVVDAVVVPLDEQDFQERIPIVEAVVELEDEEGLSRGTIRLREFMMKLLLPV